MGMGIAETSQGVMHCLYDNNPYPPSSFHSSQIAPINLFSINYVCSFSYFHRPLCYLASHLHLPLISQWLQRHNPPGIGHIRKHSCADLRIQNSHNANLFLALHARHQAPSYDILHIQRTQAFHLPAYINQTPPLPPQHPDAHLPLKHLAAGVLLPLSTDLHGSGFVVHTAAVGDSSV